ncbi:putative WEB family protein At1g65010, chloroplastic isoform X2 [Lactuca sativa]|uniref:putative WEB family protein At1g65010, chloroplastic isoform X2 n=1 Tax=Lactuca sativa TaxID=4236 RepID=UPI000CD815FC|nr:putative WEB family protein At1g65010, chloroplastic isoform X2 [Lactuca sativa]
MLRSKSRSGYLEFGQKKHQSFLIRSISGSKICRGDALASQVAKEAVVSVDRKSISLSENRIVKAAMMQKQVTDLEEELKNTKARLNEAEREKNRLITEVNAGLSKAFEAKLAERDKYLEQLKKELATVKDESKKQMQELEDQVEKAKQSESKMLESLMFQTQEIMQTKMDLEESKLEVASLYERLENGGNNNTSKGNYNYNHNQNQKQNQNQNQNQIQNQASMETIALKEEIAKLKNEVKHAMEGEEKSKKAMDGLASALQEVATEASMTNEKLRSTEAKVSDLSSEVERLTEELEIQREEYDRLRVESEESYLTWSSKEMGFITCIKKSDEESAAAKHENNRLKEALVSAENTARIAREEAFKLRDILKQALNESNVAKEASNIARSENSELKDLLAEKEDALHFLTKENERLRINEVAARENVKEFKRLLAAKAEAEKFYDEKEHNDDFDSPLSCLYEDHYDGRGTPRQTFSFDFDDLKAFNKDDDVFNNFEDETVADIAVGDDPEKAEALKGSIFDMSASPKSEPQTPKFKPEHRRASSIYTDAGGVGQGEEGENAGSSGHSHSHGHTEDGDDRSYYSRKKLFKKIGELIVGKQTSKKEGSETPKEHGKEKEQSKEQSKEHSKEKEQSKEKEKEQGKEKEEGKEGKELETTTHHSSGFSGYTTAGWKKVALYYGPYGGSKDS